MGALDSTLGSMLIATATNLWFFGLASYQYGLYFRTRKWFFLLDRGESSDKRENWRQVTNDRLPLKATVVVLCALDCTNSALALYTTYYYLVSGFANLATLNTVLWAIPAVILFINASSGITHFFFSWRIFQLTRSHYIFGALLVLQVATVSVGIVTGVHALQVNSFAAYSVVSNILTSWLSLQAAVDILLSALLIWIFRISRTGICSTNAVLNRMMRGALQTGVISSAFSIGYLLSFVLAPGNLIWMVFGYCLGRIYSITLMDTLICRHELKEKLANSHSGGINHSPDAFQLQPSASQGVIRIHTQVQQETDVDPSTLDGKYGC
ncbi:hypothetical protein K435DRAFT_971280 [Dendrothele bispora CBS 962.96]|uniref:DUF6534 domain-containing protein n=1 Tax=Dendrothele bispora (strain CBS 962.96) TaxID=1314807 RepID=A0A4S8L6V1_DENBC|nr:hypothetical protein K435DRAFT_971280 [Dendrothele bispora CBS 962.96]